MNIEYSDDIVQSFDGAYNFYNKDKSSYVGFGGNINNGEYIQLFFDLDLDTNNYLNSTILNLKYSAIGNIVLIACCEKLCLMSEGQSLTNLLHKINNDDELFLGFKIEDDRKYIIDIIISAIYNMLSTMSEH